MRQTCNRCVRFFTGLPKTNCLNCWRFYFSVRPGALEEAAEFIRKGWTAAVAKVYGKKYVQAVERLMLSKEGMNGS